LATGTDVRRAAPSCPTPDTSLNSYLEEAYGFVDIDRAKYRFVAAREVDWDGNACIRVQFQALAYEGTLTIHHARDFGYWPVHVELIKGDGTVVYELSDVRFGVMERDGNRLYFPVRYVQRSYPQGKGNRLEFQVREGSLRINEPIPHTKFRLEQWPNEKLGDLDANTVTPAKDQQWKPDSRLTFPFDVFEEALQKARGSQESKQLNSAAHGIDARSTTGIQTSPAVPSDAGSSAATLLTSSLVGVGMLLIGGGAWSHLRRRRST
jgi:hypothetical protein